MQDAPHVELGDRPVGRYDPAIDDPSHGRRLRAFAAMVFRGDQAVVVAARSDAQPPLLQAAGDVTYRELLDRVEHLDLADRRDAFDHIPLRVGASARRGRCCSKCLARRA